ncbi:hypothetical protein VTN02DRAFT_5286 [Thermoascus thermophilus]
MVVQFCEDCGNLLDISPADVLKCELCGQTAKNEALSYTRQYVSEQFPSRLRSKLKSNTQVVDREVLGSGPRIEVDCVKCPSKEVTYAQVQLRSADEGSTIFYRCLRCGHR